MTIFTRGGSRQSQDVFGLDVLHYPFEGESGNMVAFIDDHLAVTGNEIIHLALSMQALDHSDINGTRSFMLASTNLPD